MPPQVMHKLFVPALITGMLVTGKLSILIPVSQILLDYVTRASPERFLASRVEHCGYKHSEIVSDVRML